MKKKLLATLAMTGCTLPSPSPHYMRIPVPGVLKFRDKSLRHPFPAPLPSSDGRESRLVLTPDRPSLIELAVNLTFTGFSPAMSY